MSRESKILTAIIVIVVGGMIGIFVVLNGGSDNSSTNLGDTHFLSTPAPWDANITGLRARLSSINLPALSAEGTVLHIHQHLDIYLHGKPVSVPANIGIDQADGFISELHVHDTSGVVHVESPTQKDFNFGQFMDVWGVKFDATHLGSYVSDSTSKLKFFVNGTEVASDPRNIKLAAHQEIVISFGTDAELPSPIPASYTFPSGE